MVFLIALILVLVIYGIFAYNAQSQQIKDLNIENAQYKRRISELEFELKHIKSKS